MGKEEKNENVSVLIALTLMSRDAGGGWTSPAGFFRQGRGRATDSPSPGLRSAKERRSLPTATSRGTRRGNGRL